MEQLNVALAVTGAVVVAIGLLSNLLKKSLLQEPMAAVFVGIAVGPYGLGWLDVKSWGDETTILEQATRLTLAVSLMGIALRLETHAVKVLWRPVALLVTVGMVGMWLASSALAGGLLGLPLWTALLLGAVVTPTDPIVTNSIVSGPFAKKHLPLRVRDTISFESGANDGLAYLLVMLPVLMIGHPADEAWSRWLVESLLVGVGGAFVIGLVAGYVAAVLLDLAVRSGIIEETSLLSFAVALALFTLGVAERLHTDALFAVFVAGVVFNLRIRGREKDQKGPVLEAVAKLFMLPMFVVFGLVLPFGEWENLGWPLLLLALLLPLLRRPPVFAALLPGLRRSLNGRDVAYVGWFGPVGIAAIYYAVFAQGHTGDPLFWHAASALIFTSILVHGLTAAPLTKLYARHRKPAPPRTKHLEEAAE
ncbi:MAG TPA: cation:proton antiporter [Microvirga sp.]|jgi:NhaP-type Na+/H+ or K+/H+ antiporter|nr:cation:proton antiporter [Microvirga sp.]